MQPANLIEILAREMVTAAGHEWQPLGLVHNFYIAFSVNSASYVLYVRAGKVTVTKTQPQSDALETVLKMNMRGIFERSTFDLADPQLLEKLAGLLQQEQLDG